MFKNRLLLSSALTAALVLAAFAFHARPAALRASPGRAFYFWKTQWNATPAVQAALAQGGISKVYMRFFDVRWSPEAGEPRPVSPLRFVTPPPAHVEVVPVVYLVNEVFRHTRYAEVEALADHIVARVQAMAKDQGIQVKELQIDCDWSDSTRRNYFHFAELLRQKLRRQNAELSATIRLHQIKYAERTGVPPVDRGMLMFYNFGRIQADSPRSSIFNADDARRYTSYIGGYKLPLDISLPLFSWVVHSRDGRVLSLIEKMGADELAASTDFEAIGSTKFKAKKSFFLHGTYFMAGDLLLVEESTPQTTRAAADLALDGAGWRKSYQTVALFDLDERNLTRYENQDLQRILAKF